MIRASVIIPTRDRAELLDRCLQSLTRQTLPPEAFEVIVVDNGSSDETPRVAESHASRLNLSYVAAPAPGLHVGRHAGLRAARSDVLMYSDDDIEAEPTWVETVIRAFGDADVALVGGNNLPRFEAEPPRWLARWWEQPVYRGRALGYLSVLDFGRGRFPLDPAYVWGCNFSVRRKVLEAVGGFHPDGMPQELLYLRGDGESHVARAISKRGWKTVFDSDASVHHLVSKPRMTRRYFEGRAFMQGVSDSYTAVRRRGAARLSTLQLVRIKLRPVFASLRERIRSHRDEGPDTGEFLNVRLAALEAWEQGFAFHQAELKSRPELLPWVLKDSYLT